MTVQLQDSLIAYFRRGVQAASPSAALAEMLPAGQPQGRTIVLGCGKAAAAMAEVAAASLPGDVVGLVVTRYGHGTAGSTGPIEVIEASHPVPDAMSLMAGQRIRELASSAGADDRVIFLISGGGSALLSDPVEGVTLAQKAAITRHLVRSGAPIGDINLVRRHLSRVKGGRLAAAAAVAKGDMHTFLISDVVGDAPVAIASGPSIRCPFEPDRAVQILTDTGWVISDALVAAIGQADAGEAPEHPVHLVANGRTALDAIAAVASDDGWTVHQLGDAIVGDAAETGRSHAALALNLARQPGRHLILSGGELTVTVRNRSGRGGPNLEYLAGMMNALPSHAPITALACDSDGIDGSEDNAGAWFDAASRAARAECEAALIENLTYDLFDSLGTLIKTGPTLTNVNDIRMIAIEGEA